MRPCICSRTASTCGWERRTQKTRFTPQRFLQPAVQLPETRSALRLVPLVELTAPRLQLLPGALGFLKSPLQFRAFAMKRLHQG